jgi:hypothetical protein
VLVSIPEGTLTGLEALRSINASRMFPRILFRDVSDGMVPKLLCPHWHQAVRYIVRVTDHLWRHSGHSGLQAIATFPKDLEDS